MNNAIEFDIPTVVVSKEDFERAKHATIMKFKPRTFKGKLPPVCYMIEDNKAMVFGVRNSITFRRRFSRDTVTRSLQTILIDTSEMLNGIVEVYLNERKDEDI